MQLELVNQDSASHHTVIQVIGIGGGGSNAVQRMIESGLEGVQFVMANTDLQALERFQSPRVQMLPLGEKITGGLGAGGNPELGKEAAKEDSEKIQELLADAHMVFITAGMGGGTGTGAAPVIAEAAKSMDKLCVAVVTTPFHFEGRRKYELALQGLDELSKVVDILIVIPNQLLLEVLEAETSVREAFMNADEVLRMGVKGIADLITRPGYINVDFNDVCTVMRDGGKALMGIGISSGPDRAEQATRQALENPLLNGSEMKGATGILVQITADESFSLGEYSCIMEEINAYVDTESATVISGIAIEQQKKDEIKVTVIATGFNSQEEFDESHENSTYQSKQNSQTLGNIRNRNVGNHRTKNKSHGYNGYNGYNDYLRRHSTAPKSGMQNPLQAPLETPMSASPVLQSPERSPQRNNSQSMNVMYDEIPYTKQNAHPLDNEAGQAVQMRQTLQQHIVSAEQNSNPNVYQMTEKDNRLLEERQVSNTELELLFAEKVPATADTRIETRSTTLGQKRAEPQLPPGQNEDLYIPAVFRRKQKQRKK